ncbi:hypothetical protein RB195_022338 [Necator americanus]|uniref:MULE transposase domain-containing protein n=1 Tax=Necator americanus TaxID=51031 RepID=A0ABR1EFW8_NECAM
MFIIYFELIAMACENELCGFIGDGIHKLNPIATANRTEEGQTAIRAARGTFPEAELEGSAFHFAQAWNRMAKELGLKASPHESENAHASKSLLKRGEMRRQKIDDAMESFKEKWKSRSDISTIAITTFCQRMARFVTEKTMTCLI